MRTFQFSPNIRTWDLVINEENFKKAWEKANAKWEKAPWTWIENKLWSIFSAAVDDEEYPMFNVYPWGSNWRTPYTISEIEDEFPLKYYDFCFQKAKEVAKDLGIEIGGE